MWSTVFLFDFTLHVSSDGSLMVCVYISSEQKPHTKWKPQGTSLPTSVLLCTHSVSISNFFLGWTTRRGFLTSVTDSWTSGGWFHNWNVKVEISGLSSAVLGLSKSEREEEESLAQSFSGHQREGEGLRYWPYPPSNEGCLVSRKSKPLERNVGIEFPAFLFSAFMHLTYIYQDLPCANPGLGARHRAEDQPGQTWGCWGWYANPMPLTGLAVKLFI